MKTWCHFLWAVNLLKKVNGLFKIKHTADGTPQCYEARLVAKGCSQTFGIDYTETFFPAVYYKTLSMSIVMSTLYNINHLDAVVVFLQGSFEVEIYIEAPESLEFSNERGNKKDEKIVDFKGEFMD